MDQYWHWGIPSILWLQQFSPTLDVPFRTLSALGDETFLMVLLPFVYWCLNRRLGARLACLYLVTACVSGLAKVLGNQPRPYEVDARVQRLGSDAGRGFPSLHTASAVTIWGYLALQVRRTWMWILAACLIFLIPLSRLYVGVHFPFDLLGGYVIGFLLLWLFVRFEPPIEQWLARQSLAVQLLLTWPVPMAMFLLVPGDEIGMTAAGMLLGAGAGLALERRWVLFRSEGTWVQWLLRFAIGFAVMYGLRLGLKAAFDGLLAESIARFVRYAIIGLWFAAGAPWVFVRLRLAETEPSAETAQNQAGLSAGVRR